MIDAEVNRQAAMIAYLNDFWLMAIVTAISVPLVLLLQKPGGKWRMIRPRRGISFRPQQRLPLHIGEAPPCPFERTAPTK